MIAFNTLCLAVEERRLRFVVMGVTLRSSRLASESFVPIFKGVSSTKYDKARPPPTFAGKASTISPCTHQIKSMAYRLFVIVGETNVFEANIGDSLHSRICLRNC